VYSSQFIAASGVVSENKYIFYWIQGMGTPIKDIVQPKKRGV
jgi:hypothetical protein